MAEPTNQRVFASYSEYYAAPSVDINRDNYEGVLNHFAATNPATPEQLLTTVLASIRAPQVFVAVMTGQRNEPRIHVLHRPAKIVAQLGCTTAWEGQVFATNGDVQGTMAVTVQFPDDPFTLTTPVRVLPIDAITEWFVLHPEDLTVPTVANNAPGSREITTRNVMYLPCMLAPLLLKTTGYTPREFWSIAVPMLREAGKLEECKVFMEWLQVACTLTWIQRTQTRRVAAIIQMREALVLPLMDEELHKEREGIINNDLRGRFTEGLSYGQAILRLADAVTQQRPPVVTIEKDKEEKSPAQKWPQTLPILMRFKECLSEADLPTVYINIAKASKQEVRKVIQNMMIERSNAPTAYCSQAIVVTPSFASMVAEFDFVAGDADTLTHGLHPFILNNGTAAQRTASLQNAAKFDLIEANAFGITLSDLETLLAKEAKHTPLTFTELEITVTSFGDVLVVLLGATHSITEAYKLFLEEWKRARLRLNQMIDIMRVLEPAHVMRRIQLSLFLWFDTVRRGGTPRPIEFVNILDDINLSTFIKPHMPPSFYKVNTDPPALNNTPTEPPHAVGNAKIKTSVIINPAGPDAKLYELFEGLRLREVIKNEVMPTNRTGTTMCLAYHCKGQCYSNCKRLGDHKAHNAAEQKALLAASERAVKSYKEGKRIDSGMPTSMGVPP